jgi:hypothetical protein
LLRLRLAQIIPNVPDVAACGVRQRAEETSAMEALPISPPDREAWAERVVAAVRAERDSVRDFLAGQEERLEKAEAAFQDILERFEEAVESASSAASEGIAECADDQDFQRRYEMALDDLRELKAANSVLQDQLTKARSTASALAKDGRSQGPHLDWEAEKLRILAALESDFDEHDAGQRAERIKIEDVLQITESAIAARDSEILELKEQLEQATGSSQAEAKVAAAIADALDTNTAVQAELSRLKQLEDDMQSKLRKAEIDISLERAKFARERSELEDRIRSLEANIPKAPTVPGTTPEPEPTRGRWLSRLGLTEADRERSRRNP